MLKQSTKTHEAILGSKWQESGQWNKRTGFDLDDIIEKL